MGWTAVTPQRDPVIHAPSDKQLDRRRTLRDVSARLLARGKLTISASETTNTPVASASKRLQVFHQLFGDRQPLGVEALNLVDAGAGFFANE